MLQIVPWFPFKDGFQKASSHGVPTLYPHISPKLFGEPIMMHNLVQRNFFVQVQAMTLFVKQNADKGKKTKQNKTTF